MQQSYYGQLIVKKALVQRQINQINLERKLMVDFASVIMCDHFRAILDYAFNTLVMLLPVSHLHLILDQFRLHF